MKKQLPTSTIANELTGASVFFQPSSTTPLATEPGQPVAPHAPSSPLPVAALDRPKVQQAVHESPPEQQPELSQSPAPAIQKQQDTMPPRYHATTPPQLPASPPSNPNATESPRYHATVTATQLETVRKAVRQLGKEAATHRFTGEEKQALAAVVYAYACRGCRTSENELTRIAINWLLLDYQAQGEQSVLAQVVQALNE
ncbi:MAG: hypothetical protein U0350_48685 [Caldilineaceae bacterium]